LDGVVNTPRGLGLRSAPGVALAGIEPIGVGHLADAVAYLRGYFDPPPVQSLLCRVSFLDWNGPVNPGFAADEDWTRARRCSVGGGRGIATGARCGRPLQDDEGLVCRRHAVDQADTPAKRRYWRRMESLRSPFGSE
jgi:hypothetical protein